MMNAGQAGWTRDLARDLFPGAGTSFAWTLLAGPADRALRNAYAELGSQAAPDAPFWSLARGYGYLNAAAVAEADQDGGIGAGHQGRPAQAIAGAQQLALVQRQAQRPAGEVGLAMVD